jgi:hypothetical protein
LQTLGNTHLKLKALPQFTCGIKDWLEELEIKSGLLNTCCKNPKLLDGLLSSFCHLLQKGLMRFACGSGANHSWFPSPL